jgi:dienelactone hydrolase
VRSARSIRSSSRSAAAKRRTAARARWEDAGESFEAGAAQLGAAEAAERRRGLCQRQSFSRRRGYDGSDGTSNMFGWGETKDIDAAVAWLRQQPDVRNGRVGGIGFSVGGEMMLEAAALNPALRAVVSEGACIRSIHEELLHGAGASPQSPRRRCRPQHSPC